MGDEGSYVSVDGKSLVVIFEMTAGASIDVPVGESVTIRDGGGVVLLTATGPTTVSGPLSLMGNPS